jgi:excisionase family DNA binding protein
MLTIMTAKEAAKFLNLNVFTVYAYSRRKIIPSIRSNKLVRFDMEDLKKWVERQKVKEIEK